MVEIKAEIKLPGEDALNEVVKGGRGAMRRVLGPALAEFGEMLTDQMKLWRFNNLLRIQAKVDRITKARSVSDSLLQALPFGDAMRTIEAASQEDEDAVQELWAQLIVNAGTSAERPSINKMHIEILRSLTPADSVLLELLYPNVMSRSFASNDELTEFNVTMNAKADSGWRQLSGESRDVAVQNLLRLRCITATPRSLNTNSLLVNIENHINQDGGYLVDARRLQEVFVQLLIMIYQASGAIPYDTTTPLPANRKNPFGRAFGSFGSIDVPELGHMLTPLGEGFMRAITLDRTTV